MESCNEDNTVVQKDEQDRSYGYVMIGFLIGVTFVNSSMLGMLSGSLIGLTIKQIDTQCLQHVVAKMSTALITKKDD